VIRKLRAPASLRAALLVSAVFCNGCAVFTSQTPLPRRASLEANTTPEADEQLAAVVREADVIYLPTDRLGSALASESAWKLVQAMRRSGVGFAVGWDAIDASEQSRLDDWSNRRSSVPDFPDRLDLSGSARDRENCRVFLRQTRPLQIRQLALRCPELLIRKIRSGNPLTPSDEALLPHGYRVPREGLQASSQSAPDSTEAMLAIEFAAERIVEGLREHQGGKLLVFLRRADLDNAQGVPFFVAQKVNVRQVVLDSKQPPAPRTNLLSLRDGAVFGRRFEIVNRPPRA